jgi:hypothetical protein
MALKAREIVCNETKVDKSPIPSDGKPNKDITMAKKEEIDFMMVHQYLDKNAYMYPNR